MSEPRIDLSGLEGRVDDFLLRQLRPEDAPFRLRTGVPKPTWNRFDLGFKLLWLDSCMRAPSRYAERVYEAHIAAFSLGDLVEPGNLGKEGIARFRQDFGEIFDSVQRSGFDPGRSLVPLASDGSLLNAGHRAACAIALDAPVVAVETDLAPKPFDFRFFAKRGMADADLDAAAIRMVEAMPNVALALIWPAAAGQEARVERVLGPLVYRRNVRLSLNGGHTLLSRVYHGEPWLGPAENNFPGIRNKLLACFNGRDDLRVLIFDAPPERDRVALKSEVRAFYGIEKSSIHITDTHDEAVEIAHLLLNQSARHFLNHGRPMAFGETRAALESLQAYKAANGRTGRDFIVDTGMVLGLYGVRPPSDIDVISPTNLPSGPFEQHDARHHSAGAGDLLQDPAFQFRYAGITFCSLAEVHALKAQRLAGQDREDLLRIAPLLEDAPVQARVSRTLKMRLAHLKARRTVIRSLMAVGIGRPLRKLYRRAFRRGL